MRRWIELAGALVLLNASLTFQNVWPTPAVRFGWALSVELAGCVLVLVAASSVIGSRSASLLRWIAAFWVVLVVGRYADVTAPGLYGRDINLYWDSRHLSNVVAMLARVAALWQILLVLAVVVLIPLLLYIPLRWALGRLNESLRRPADRRVFSAVSVIALIWFAGQRLDDRWPTVPGFSKPVTETYVRQARLLTGELTGRSAKALGPAPSLSSDLGALGGADVFLIFIESYGAISYDRPEFAAELADSRARLAADIKATGRGVVSAYVESPTFGGSSWLAHISLLSGFEIRDEDTDTLLMSQQRDTLVTTFSRGGYRTVAIMPGLQQNWPEGAFYRFDDIYGEKRLDYRGPQFGWWTIPDQFAIARMDALEVNKRSRPPVFLFFPTTSTHTPFSPTAPYQPDWKRMLTDQPYDDAAIARTWLDAPDWLNLSSSYAHALSYAYDSIGGYLRLRADRDFVMILIGDHQPPAAVSGEGASWEVPVHIIASREKVLERLVAGGFQRGLTPQHPALARMHALTPVMLDAFADGPAISASEASHARKIAKVNTTDR